MSHYFSSDNDKLKSNEKKIYVVISDMKFNFITDNGVFSKSGLDFGSRVLIETIKDMPEKRVLDLGCGYGPIAVILGKFWKDSRFKAVDINERAIKLAKINAELNRTENIEVEISNGFENINSKYNMIITNPPIRAGKKIIYDFFEESINYLEKNGSLVFVMNKKQGALSAIKKCQTIYNDVEVINSKSGYMIVRCKNN